MKLDRILKQTFWAPIAILLAMASLLHAQAITRVIGVALSPDPADVGRSLSPLRVPTLAVTRVTSAASILSRNPFDSVTGPLDKIGSLQGAADMHVDLDDPMNAPPCDDLRVSAIAASTSSDWSFASFSPLAGGDTKSVLRRRGGEVGGKTVTFIGWDRVWLTGSGALCQIEMFKPRPPASAPPIAAATSAETGGLDPAIRSRIERLSATEFKVDRAVVDKIIENPADLMRARIVPEQVQGQMAGFRIFGVRPDALLGVLGIENGDRLETINGFEMTSAEKALEAFARLRTADHLSVQVNRQGRTMSLEYTIQ